MPRGGPTESGDWSHDHGPAEGEHPSAGAPASSTPSSSGSPPPADPPSRAPEPSDGQTLDELDPDGQAPDEGPSESRTEAALPDLDPDPELGSGTAEGEGLDPTETLDVETLLANELSRSDPVTAPLRPERIEDLYPELFADEGDEDDDEQDDGPLRGWIDPDDRLWRHPSETAAGRRALPRRGAFAGGGRIPARQVRHRPSPAALGLVAASAALVGLAGAVALRGFSEPAPGPRTQTLNAADAGGSGGGTVVTAPIGINDGPVTTVGTGNVAPGTISQQLRGSVVALLDPSGSVVGTGVVFDSGLVLTAASTLAATSTIEVETAAGAKLGTAAVGYDARAGIGVLRVPINLPPATFADEPIPAGSSLFATCLCRASSSGDLEPTSGVTQVVSEGDDLASDNGPSLLDAFEAEVPGGATPGSLLVDRLGHVVGVQAGAWHNGDTGRTVALFVPGWLADNLGEELAAGQEGEHGWLGVFGSPAQSVCGVAITSVLGGSPAAAADLVAGDTIVSVDNFPVCQPGDLAARLYVDPPGHEISLGLLDPSGGSETIGVNLGSSG